MEFLMFIIYPFAAYLKEAGNKCCKLTPSACSSDLFLGLESWTQDRKREYWIQPLLCKRCKTQWFHGSSWRPSLKCHWKSCPAGVATGATGPTL